jgi:hypothetical protein
MPDIAFICRTFAQFIPQQFRIEKIMKSAFVLALTASALALAPLPLTQFSGVAHAASVAHATICGPCTAAANATVDGIQGPPESAGAVVQLEHAMFLINKVVEYIKANCVGDPQYESQLASYADLYQQSLNTCRQVATDASMCGPRQYGQ